MIINDLSVAPFNIDAVSSISCIKVETPRSYKRKENTSSKVIQQGYNNKIPFYGT